MNPVGSTAQQGCTSVEACNLNPIDDLPCHAELKCQGKSKAEVSLAALGSGGSLFERLR